MMELLGRAGHTLITHDWDDYALGRRLFRAQWYTLNRMLAMLFHPKAPTPTCKDNAHITATLMWKPQFNSSTRLTFGHGSNEQLEELRASHGRERVIKEKQVCICACACVPVSLCKK